MADPGAPAGAPAGGGDAAPLGLENVDAATQYILLATVQQASDNYADAVRSMTGALRLERSSDSYLKRGVSLLCLRRPHEAICNFNECLRLQPSNVSARVNRGTARMLVLEMRASSEVPRFDEILPALQDLDESLRLQPGNVLALINRGCAFQRVERHRQAIADFDACLALNPTHASALFNRGISYRRTGRLDDAVRDFDRVIELHPREPNAYYNRGFAHLKLLQFREALSDFEQCLAHDDASLGAVYYRGVAHANLAHYHQAVADFVTVTQRAPTNAEAYYNLARARRELAQYELALADMDHCLARLGSPNSSALYLRATLLASLKRHADAVHTFTEALELELDYDTLVQRAVSYANLDQLADALADLDRAIALDPAPASAFYSRGIVHASLELHEKAIADFREAIRRDSAHVESYTHRAESLMTLGRNEVRAPARLSHALTQRIHANCSVNRKHWLRSRVPSISTTHKPAASVREGCASRASAATRRRCATSRRPCSCAHRTRASSSIEDYATCISIACARP